MSRGVRGPNSALTEFLRERGINAAQIRQRAEDRARQAEAERLRTQGENTNAEEAPLPPRRRRRGAAAEAQAESSLAAASAAAIEEVKNKKRKRGPQKKKKSGDSGDEDYSMPYSLPDPGQIAFCAECEARFTVTTYSRASADGGGLLCNPCGKKYSKEEKEAKKKRTTNKRTKKEVLRAALDGEAAGARSLKDICIRLVAKHIENVEALGDLANKDMDRIRQIISRERSLNNQTIKLFTQGKTESLSLYDCARIDTDPLLSIATALPDVKHLSFLHAGRVTDSLLQTYAKSLSKLNSFHIRGAFLVSRQAYCDFLAIAGPRLKSLTIAGTARTNEGVFKAIAQHCPNLEHLELSNLTRLDDACVLHVSPLENLKSLNLSFAGGDITDEPIVTLLNKVGSNLESLDLSGNASLTSSTTNAIHACCPKLTSLSLAECPSITNDDIKSIFINWDKNRGLVELNIARIEELKDDGLLAIARHSGARLESININSCRKLTKEGILEALKYIKKLAKADAGFVRDVDDEVVEKFYEAGVGALAIWGCHRVTCVVQQPPMTSLVGREADIVAY